MKTAAIILAILAGSLALAAGVCALWGVGAYNSAKTLRNQYEAKDRSNQAVFDNMWKKISQSAPVTDAQRAALKDVFVSYAAARTGSGDGGSLAKWVQESVPSVDVSVYRNLQNIVAGARDEWTANQVAMVDIAREYNLLLEKFPTNVLLAALGFRKIDARVVTSDRTDAAYRSGKDNDVALPTAK